MGLETLVRAIIYNADELTSSETELLLSKASASTLEQLRRGTLDGPAALRLRKRGWQGAKAAAALTTDPAALATLARHVSVQVRRQVAANRHVDTETVDYLWSWALKHDDSDTLETLASRATPAHLADLLAGPNVATAIGIVERVIRNTDPVLWPELLRAASTATDSRSVWRAASAMTHVAADVNASLCALYDAAPEFGSTIVRMAVKRAYLNADVVELIARYRHDHPTAPATYPETVAAGFDDEAMVELFAADPDAARQIGLSKAHGPYPKTAQWLLQHARDYPEQARAVLSDGLGSINATMGPEVDAVLRASATTGDPVALKAPGMLLNRLAPYRLSSEALLALFRYQPRNQHRTVDAWLGGRFSHQLPTGDEIAALFADPHGATGTLRKWVNGRPVDQPLSIPEFAKDLRRSELAEILRTEWVDEFMDALGPSWRYLVSDSQRFGRYLLGRIHTEVGTGAEALRVALELLDRSEVSLSATLRAARSLLPESAAA